MSAKKSFYQRVQESITLKLITMGVLVLLLLIPVNMVNDLIKERYQRQKSVFNEVTDKWGDAQTLIGPVLKVPYLKLTRVVEIDENKEEKITFVETVELAYFLPDELKFEGKILPEMRYRGIYEIVVYNSQVVLSGQFSTPDLSFLNVAEENILWDQAAVLIQVSEQKAIQENLVLNWNETQSNFNPDPSAILLKSKPSYYATESKSYNYESHCLKSNVEVRPFVQGEELNYNFSLAINLNGSESLNFIPIGKETNVSITSTWPNPSFGGHFLPDSKTISESGFDAQWKVLHVNRSYPQQFSNPNNYNFENSSFGVELFVPVDHYQKSTRAAKYSVLFIVLTFLIFFFVQLLNKVRIHPFQFLIIGITICIFYTLLIAISEHLSFGISYLISSLTIIGLITTFSAGVSKNTKVISIISGVLAVLYIFIFAIIQMEDYALLVGNIGLVVIMAVVIYLSNKVNWYQLKNEE